MSQTMYCECSAQADDNICTENSKSDAFHRARVELARHKYSMPPMTPKISHLPCSQIFHLRLAEHTALSQLPNAVLDSVRRSVSGLHSCPLHNIWQHLAEEFKQILVNLFKL